MAVKEYRQAPVFIQQQARDMYRLLEEIHKDLATIYSKRNFSRIPAYAINWMVAIEDHLPKEKQVMKIWLKKNKPKNKPKKKNLF